jgi:hypothetical protein
MLVKGGTSDGLTDVGGGSARYGTRVEITPAAG